MFSKMMNLAEEWGLRPDGSNPCRHLRKYREEKRRRYLTKDELLRLGVALGEAKRNRTENPFAIGAVILLILTGARLSEILTLRWEWVDLTNGVLRLPELEDRRKRDLSQSSCNRAPRRHASHGWQPARDRGTKGRRHLIDLQKPWRRLRASANVHDVRIHDLRHSFASIAAGIGTSLPMIGRLLGHTQPATTARYAHLAADPIRAASNLIGSAITAAMNSTKRPLGG